MKNIIIIAIVITMLGGLLVSAAYASYSGYGLVASESTNARGGSLRGPVLFLSGGPGGGK